MKKKLQAARSLIIAGRNNKALHSHLEQYDSRFLRSKRHQQRLEINANNKILEISKLIDAKDIEKKLKKLNYSSLKANEILT
jgi:hypothetical protein